MLWSLLTTPREKPPHFNQDPTQLKNIKKKKKKQGGNGCGASQEHGCTAARGWGFILARLVRGALSEEVTFGLMPEG